MAWRTIAAAGIVVAGAFGAISLIALEGREVVLVRTVDEHGTVHDTRTWIAEDGEGIWIEAATPDRPFARHIARSAQAEIVRDRDVRRYAASIADNPAGHERIRALLAEKYGWADCWIGLLQDTSGSVAVRFVAPGKGTYESQPTSKTSCACAARPP
jgi:hypothetical protein